MPLQEIAMKKLIILAALLTSTGYAYAGNNSISFEINGHKVRIESPRNCDQLSCLKISGVDFGSFNSNSFNDKSFNDDVAVKSDPPAPESAPAPIVQTHSPAPAVQ